LSDAEAVFLYRSNKSANRFQGFVPQSVEEVEDFIHQKVAPVIDSPGTWFQMVIISRHSGKLIGDIGLHFMKNRTDAMEVGCTLSSTEQNKGYATESLGAVIDFMAKEFDKTEIHASIDPRNAPSAKMLNNLGFEKNTFTPRAFMHNGEWVDDETYVLYVKK
jgi:RimJ/RimL family protein N-acetyltransferase